ncbi:MAG: DUF485 domain-containing protein [Beijerinckiaceae bacterium]
MTPDDSTIHTVHSIAAKRWKIAIALSVIMLVIYFGFIVLVAVDKPFMSILLMPGLSVGILLGALTIVSCFILNGIYVVWANRVYDEEVAQVLRLRRTS